MTRFLCYAYAKQKHAGCKMCEANQKQQCKYVRPKTLISAEAKKLLIKIFFDYLNDTQYFIACFHNYDWLNYLATFIIMMVQ